MGDDPRNSPAWRLDPASYVDQRPPTHGIAPPISHYLTMSDGVRLAIDIWLPDGARPDDGFPAILIFTPYYRRFRLAEGATVEASPNSAPYRQMFVPRSYALVVVDVRGSGASFGCRDSFRSPKERADYAEVMRWVAAQDWCDGRLGATGISYLGAASDFAAATGEPALKAIAPISAVWDTYTDQFYPGGILLTDLATGYGRIMEALDQDDRAALRQAWEDAGGVFVHHTDVDDDPDGALLAEALADHAGNCHMPDFLREFQFRDDALAHDPGFTSDSFSPHAASPGMRDDLAVMAISGWYDGAYMNGSISRFLSRAGPRYLLLGPWDHGARVNGSPFRAGVVPEFPILGSILRFFDEHVRGEDTGLQAEAPVHYHCLRAENWRAAQQWPPEHETLTLHLSSDALSVVAPDPGHLHHKADYRCTTGLNTRYGRLQIRNVQNYYEDWDQHCRESLRLTTAPLDAPLVLTGHAVLDLGFTCDEADANVLAYLEDIAPDGTAHYVTEGMLRALNRAETNAPQTYPTTWPWRGFNRADAQPLIPGEETRLVFPFLPTSWQFPAGHRIGLRLAGADRHNFALWPYGRPGTWTIATGPEGSTLTLPVERA